MEIIQCDICKQTENVSYCLAIKKKFKMWKFFWDSQGGIWNKQDICDKCFEAIQEYVKHRNQRKQEKHENKKCGNSNN